MTSRRKIAASVTCIALTSAAVIFWQVYKEKATERRLSDEARLIRIRADQGDAKAQNRLGNLYFDGRGVPKDLAEAVRWYRKGADQGYTKAQFNLGSMYYYGKGVPPDYAEALCLFRKAADQGDATAQIRPRRHVLPRPGSIAGLGRCYRLVPQGGRPGQRNGSICSWSHLLPGQGSSAGLRPGYPLVPQGRRPWRRGRSNVPCSCLLSRRRRVAELRRRGPLVRQGRDFMFRKMPRRTATTGNIGARSSTGVTHPGGASRPLGMCQLAPLCTAVRSLGGSASSRTAPLPVLPSIASSGAAKDYIWRLRAHPLACVARRRFRNLRGSGSRRSDARIRWQWETAKITHPAGGEPGKRYLSGAEWGENSASFASDGGMPSDLRHDLTNVRLPFLSSSLDTTS